MSLFHKDIKKRIEKYVKEIEKRLGEIPDFWIFWWDHHKKEIKEIKYLDEQVIKGIVKFHKDEKYAHLKHLAQELLKDLKVMKDQVEKGELPYEVQKQEKDIIDNIIKKMEKNISTVNPLYEFQLRSLKGNCLLDLEHIKEIKKLYKTSTSSEQIINHPEINEHGDSINTIVGGSVQCKLDIERGKTIYDSKKIWKRKGKPYRYPEDCFGNETIRHHFELYLQKGSKKRPEYIELPNDIINYIQSINDEAINIRDKILDKIDYKEERAMEGGKKRIEFIQEEYKYKNQVLSLLDRMEIVLKAMIDYSLDKKYSLS